MKKLSGLAVLAAATCSLIPAQFYASGTPTIADTVTARVARLTKLLSLTTAQATSATSLFTTEETAISTIRTNLVTARTALTTAVEANSATGITTAANQIGTLTASEELARGTAEAAFYALLTSDQQTKYKALLEGGIDSPGHGGFGGPHGH